MKNYHISEIAAIIQAEIIHLPDTDIIVSKVEIDSRHILYPDKSIFFAL